MVLSACQTAVTDFSQLPDEAIGLPAGFLQAGVPGVVASLWPVSDFSTALAMVKFYEYHLQGDPATGEGPMQPVRAFQQTQQWLREVTNGELSNYFNAHHQLNEARHQALARMPEQFVLAGMVHFGLDEPNARPFADRPYHWAPFIFVGV